MARSQQLPGRGLVFLASLAALGAHGVAAAQAEVSTSLAELIRPGADVRTTDTVEEMLASSPEEDGVYFHVRGYRRPADDGGGLF